MNFEFETNLLIINDLIFKYILFYFILKNESPYYLINDDNMFNFLVIQIYN